MKRVIAARRQIAVDGDQILHSGDLGRNDDAVLRHAEFHGAFCRCQAGDDHGVAHDLGGVLRITGSRVLVHHPGQEFLIERAPVDADPDRLFVLVGDLDHGRELNIALFAKPHITGIDPVLRQCFGAGGVIVQQRMADIMKIADDRHVEPHQHQPVTNIRHGLRRFVAVDRDAHDL